jgi:hypothetical protein
MSVYYVYALLDPRDMEPFYIGKGKGKRAEHHLTGIDINNRLKVEYISAIRDAKLEPIIDILLENLEEDIAFTIEEELIKEYGRIINGSGILVNICESGRPPSRTGKKLSDEQKTNIKKNKEFNGYVTWNKGLTKNELPQLARSEEVKKQISASMKGIVHKSESIEKMRQALLGKPLGRPQWHTGTKGIYPPNKTSFKEGSVPWNKGKSGYKTTPSSDEKKEKISAANKGKKRTEEQKQRMRDGHAKRKQRLLDEQT